MDTVDKIFRVWYSNPFISASNESRSHRWEETGAIRLKIRVSRLVQGTCAAANNKSYFFLGLKIMRVWGDISQKTVYLWFFVFEK